jgi:hypothetical protein
MEMLMAARSDPGPSSMTGDSTDSCPSSTTGDRTNSGPSMREVPPQAKRFVYLNAKTFQNVLAVYDMNITSLTPVKVLEIANIIGIDINQHFLDLRVQVYRTVHHTYYGSLKQCGSVFSSSQGLRKLVNGTDSTRLKSERGLSGHTTREPGLDTQNT